MYIKQIEMKIYCNASVNNIIHALAFFLKLIPISPEFHTALCILICKINSVVFVCLY
jgi:hypothetical protein